MLYVLPQCPFKNRYTEDWIDIWSRELIKSGIEFKIIGDASPINSTGLFTNFNIAQDYELNQISELFHVIQDNDKVLVLDVHFPGYSTTAAQLLRWKYKNIKIYGFLHAGDWCNGDIFSNDLNKRALDTIMFEVYDFIFVSTKYHKDKIEKYFNTHLYNVLITGFPFYKEDVLKYINKIVPFEQKNKLVITGRRSQSDVNILDFLIDKYSYACIVEDMDFSDRKDYYDLLNYAKVTISLKTEETFGLSQMESTILGSIPLSPNNYSYTELFPSEFLFNNKEELCEKIDLYMNIDNNDLIKNIDMNKHTLSIENMINVIKR